LGLVNGRRKREKVGPSKRQTLIVLQKRKVQIAEGKFLDNEERRDPEPQMARRVNLSRDLTVEKKYI